MIIIPHAVVGVAIGGVSRRPWLGLLAAFASHFALDMVPHLDAAAIDHSHGMSSGPTVLICAGDAAVALALVLWMTRAQPHRRWLMWCAFTAVLIDLLDNIPPWNAVFRTWTGTAWLSALHGNLHYMITPSQWLLGLVTQCAAVAFALAGLHAHDIAVLLGKARLGLIHAFRPVTRPTLYPDSRTSARPRRIARGENPASSHQ